MKAEASQLIPRKPIENLELSIVLKNTMHWHW